MHTNHPYGNNPVRDVDTNAVADAQPVEHTGTYYDGLYLYSYRYRITNGEYELDAITHEFVGPNYDPDAPAG